MKYADQLKAIGMHALEFFVVVLACLVVAHLFKLSPEDTVAIAGTVMAALAKFSRINKSVPISDYVNGEEKGTSAPPTSSEK